MSLKTIAVTILVVLAIGAGIAFFIVYRQQQIEKQAGQELLQAQALLQEGANERAAALLTDLIQRFPKYSNLGQALFDLGQAYENLSPEQALETWRRYLDAYPGGALALEARKRCGWLALSRGRLDEAAEDFDALASAAHGSLKASGLLGIAAIAENRGDVDRARELLYRIVEENPEESVAGEAMDRLSKLNTELFISPRVTEFSQRYEVQPGDNMIVIGSKFQTTAYLIKEMNRIGDNIRAGTRITVPKPGGVKLKVDMRNKYLYVYSNMEGAEGKFFKRYPVGVAQYAERTPLGIYVIDDKSINPTWYPPDGGVIPPADPRNALGTRWMGFMRDGKDTSLGIHGTNAPETIGTSSSAGCIRMHNADVEELFILARQGTEVEIY